MKAVQSMRNTSIKLLLGRFLTNNLTFYTMFLALLIFGRDESSAQ